MQTVKLFTNYSNNDTVFANISISELIELEESNKLKIWNKQRAINMERVDEMVEYYQYEQHNFRGAIIACTIDSNSIYIIDGQHRFTCMKKIYKNEKIVFNVRIDVIKVSCEKQIEQEFVNINKAVPVPIHVLTFNESLDLLTNYLLMTYPKQIKIGVKNMRPNINLDILKDVLIESGVESLLAGNEEILKEKFISFINKLNTYSMNQIIHLACANSKSKKELQLYEDMYNKCIKFDYLIIGIWRPKFYFTWANKFYSWLEAELI